MEIEPLLRPFLGDDTLSPNQLQAISTYVDLLMKWNARINLTSIRDSEQIVQRHFGESLFAARNLLTPDSAITVADVGSGASFPGIPIKLYAPGAHVTLIDAHGKKATFLREVIRGLALTNIDVFQGRAEVWTGTAELVTLRAVEKFEDVLPIAADHVSSGGRLALLIGAGQAPAASSSLPGQWSQALAIPESQQRVLKTWQKGTK